MNMQIKDLYEGMTKEEMLFLISEYKKENYRLNKVIEKELIWRKAYFNLIENLKELSTPNLDI